MKKQTGILLVVLGILLFIGGVYCFVAGQTNFPPFHTDSVNITVYEYVPINSNIPPNVISIGGEEVKFIYTLTSKPIENPAQYNLQFVKSYQDAKNRSPYVWGAVSSSIIGISGGVGLIIYRIYER